MSSASIYLAPDVRKQLFEDAQNFIQEKRVRRLILAEKYRQTEKDKALKLLDKDVAKFERQAKMFENQMGKITESIEKLEARLDSMISLHSGIVNIEGVIADADE